MEGLSPGRMSPERNMDCNKTKVNTLVRSTSQPLASGVTRQKGEMLITGDGFRRIELHRDDHPLYSNETSNNGELSLSQNHNSPASVTLCLAHAAVTLQ